MRSARFRIPAEILLVAQSDHGVDGNGAAGRDVAGCNRDEQENCRCDGECDGVVRANAKEQARHQAREGEGGRDADEDSKSGETQPLADDEAKNVAALRAESHANSDLAGTLRNGVGNHTVNTYRRQQERDSSKSFQEQHVEPFRGDGEENDRVQSSNAIKGLIAVDGRNGLLDAGDEGFRSGSGSHDDGDRSPRILRVRNEKRGTRFIAQRVLMNVPYDADNFHPTRIVITLEALADGVLPGPIISRHRLVDDGYGRGRLAVRIREDSPGKQRDLQRREKVRGHNGIIGAIVFLLSRSTLGDNTARTAA